jgi:hypothetical protein
LKLIETVLSAGATTHSTGVTAPSGGTVSALNVMTYPAVAPVVT